MTELPQAAALSAVTNFDPAAQAASLVAASQVVALPDASTTMVVEQGQQQQDPLPHAQRWSISRDVKQVLEEVYRLEKFPSTEMRRRLAANFSVSPRQVQFWFQNRRQRDRKIIRDQGGGGATAMTVSNGGGVDSRAPYLGLPEHARQAMAAGQPVMIMPNGSCVVVPSSAGGPMQYTMPMMNPGAGFFPYYMPTQQYQAVVPQTAVSGEDGAPASATLAASAGATGVEATDAAKAPEDACGHAPAVEASAASPAIQQMLYGYPSAGAYAPGLPIVAATPFMMSNDSRSMVPVVDPNTGQLMMAPMPMAPGAPVASMASENGAKAEANVNETTEPAATVEESGKAVEASAEGGVEIPSSEVTTAS